jgi:hypothetical protein
MVAVVTRSGMVVVVMMLVAGALRAFFARLVGVGIETGAQGRRGRWDR